MHKCDCCNEHAWTESFSSTDLMYRGSDCYIMYRCTACGLHQLDSSHDPEVIASYYPKGEYYSYKSGDRLQNLKAYLYRLLFRKDSSLLTSIIGFPMKQLMRGLQVGRGDKILDVGCGGGKFLALAKSLGMVPFGVEINPESRLACAPVTNQVLIAPFDDLHEGDLFSDCPEMKFDQIVSNHVVEHAASPKAFLSSVKRHLAENGVAIISTPNPSSFYATVFRGYWSQLDSPRHLYLISPTVMHQYCQQVGLRVVSSRHLSDQFGFVGSVVYWLESSLGMAFGDAAKRGIGLLGRVLLFPLYTALNIFRFGDTVEFTISHE